MRLGHSDARPTRERKRGGLRPQAEKLEARELLAIDLVNIAGGPTTQDPGPYGILEVGQITNGGAGFAVAEAGDVNGDGFSDFLVGQPTITPNLTGVALGSGVGSQAYLVFGSAAVPNQNIDWLSLVPNQRIGDLQDLGNATQFNPLNGTPGFPYDGLTFIASQNPNAALGASVAGVGDVNGDGFADIMIGAPGANDSANTINAAGRAYLLYGGTNLNRQNKLVDFDNPTANSDLNILTFVNNIPGGALGRAVSSAGDVLPDGLPDIAIGAPSATLNSLPGNGGVYAVSGVALRPARTETVLLQNLGQGGPANVAGVIFAGSVSGDNAGFSLASGGNFSGDTVNAQPRSTLLIGSPQFNIGAGQATLVYATDALIGQGTTTNNFTSINLNRVGSAVNGVAGAIFQGENSGDQTGFAVSSAGDFNADGISDVMIGSPGFNGAAGRVNLIFGRSATPTPPGPISGVFVLGSLPTGVNQVEFDGSAPGGLVGFSISQTGLINNDAINEIVIGSPGFNNSQGQVFLIPGNQDLIGVFSLAGAEAQPIQGLIIGLTPTVAGNFNYLGSSVSGRIGTNATGRTIDGDGVGDIIVGAAGFALTGGQLEAGGAFALEGAFLPLPDVVSTGITSPIGVGDAFPPFAINATSPDELQIFILSAGSNTPGFAPFDDIDPTTITVNGVALPDPSTWTEEPDLDGDGIPDASFVFSPRTLLALPNGIVTFTVAARTSPIGAFPNRRYTGTAPVTVSGGGGGGGGGGLPSNRAVAFGNLGGGNTSALPFGERLVPSNAVLRRLRYKPLPVARAHRQFFPTNGFGFRFNNYFHPRKHVKQDGVFANQSLNGRGIYTIGRRVLRRGRFPNGLFIGRIDHKGPTIP